jgi:hypothetical protein
VCRQHGPADLQQRWAQRECGNQRVAVVAIQMDGGVRTQRVDGGGGGGSSSSV